MKLTITMSNWNREWFLDKSIYLISKQTLNQNDFELILVDDGSNIKSSKTYKTILNYKNQGIIKNFHYIKRIKKRSKYGNCAIARNIGAKFGTGDYILFTDPEVMPMSDWAEHHLIANETDFKNNIENNYVGLCLHTRWHHVINDNCQGHFLGNCYTDYNWKDIEDTWKNMEERMKNIKQMYNLTDEQIKNEFYIYRATQAGHSLSRKLFYKLRGFEENFSDQSLGLDKWGGEDTLFHIYLSRVGSKMIFLEKAKAIHVYHSKVHSNYVQVAYANKYAIEHPDQWQSNVDKEWGQIKENGFEVIF